MRDRALVLFLRTRPKQSAPITAEEFPFDAASNGAPGISQGPHLSVTDLRSVLEASSGRRCLPWHDFLKKTNKPGFGIRVDSSRGLTAATNSCLTLLAKNRLKPWLLLPVAAGGLGYGREGKFILDPSQGTLLRRLLDTYCCPLGLLADPAACITQVLNSPFQVWKTARKQLVERGFVLDGYGSSFQMTRACLLDLIWVYRATGRIKRNCLNDLATIGLQNYEWLFEKENGDFFQSPGDGILELDFALHDTDQPHYSRFLQTRTLLQARRRLRLDLDFILHTDCTGWRLIHSDGEEVSISTVEAARRISNMQASTRAGLIIDPANIEWPNSTSRLIQDNFQSAVRHLPFPFDYWLSVNSDIDWANHVQLGRTIEEICDAVGLPYAGSAYLFSRDATWPAWSQLRSHPDIGKWASSGNLDTIHGLAHSFDSPSSAANSFAAVQPVQEILDQLAACHLVPPIFTSHGGGEGVLTQGQLTTANGLAIYPERASQALDSPESPYYVLPRLKSAGVYFYNPLDVIFSPDLVRVNDLLQTKTGQDGSPYYAFSRYFPQFDDANGLSPAWSHGKHAATAQAFPAVLRHVVQEMRRTVPGSGCVIYTHLGNRVGNQTSLRLGWTEEMHQAWELLAEYYSARDKDNVVPCRIWFAATASILAYAAVLKGLVRNLTVEGNEVRIVSWDDPNLGVSIPDPQNFGASWLHGITLYVPDASQTSVSVDGLPIRHFTCNAADATGRPSITLVDASHPVPLVPGIPEDLAQWCHPGAVSFAIQDADGPLEITCASLENTQNAVIPVDHVSLRNATHWTFEVWAEDAETLWSLGFQTRACDWFEAGNRPGLSWLVQPVRVGEWHRVTFPLYDHAGSAVPHGSIEAVRINVSSDRRISLVKFRDPALLRPHPCQRLLPNARVLSGVVRAWPESKPLPGVTVECQFSTTTLHAQTDQTGRFLFAALPNLARCRVRIDQPDKKAVYTRGSLAYMTCDQFDWDIYLV